MTISPGTIQIVKDSRAVLKEHGTEIVSTFYDTLFERYPEVRKQFNTDRQRGGTTKEGGVPAQVSRLANAILAYAKNIEKVAVLLPVVERIGYRHICRDVKPVQYGAVAECLLAALKIKLGDAATEDFISAWKEAIEHLAAIFIDVEAKLRSELERKAGYSGFAEMVVDQVEQHDSKTVLSR